MTRCPHFLASSCIPNRPTEIVQLTWLSSQPNSWKTGDHLVLAPILLSIVSSHFVLKQVSWWHLVTHLADSWVGIYSLYFLTLYFASEFEIKSYAKTGRSDDGQQSEWWKKSLLCLLFRNVLPFSLFVFVSKLLAWRPRFCWTCCGWFHSNSMRPSRLLPGDLKIDTPSVT